MTTGFSFTRNYRQIECHEPGLEGLWIKVRSGITNAEQEQLVDDWLALLKYNERWKEMTADERQPALDADDTPRARERRLLAPFIVEWNALGVLAGSDDEAPLPPPCEAGDVVLRLVPRDAFDWMWATVIDGYRLSGKARDSSPPSTTTSGPQIVPSTEDDDDRVVNIGHSRRSRAK